MLICCFLGKREMAGDDVGPEMSDSFALVWSISYY